MRSIGPKPPNFNPNPRPTPKVPNKAELDAKLGVGPPQQKIIAGVVFLIYPNGTVTNSTDNGGIRYQVPRNDGSGISDSYYFDKDGNPLPPPPTLREYPKRDLWSEA